MQLSSYLKLGAVATVGAGLALVLGQQQTDPLIPQPTVVPLPAKAPATPDLNDPYWSIMDPAGYAAQRVLTPEEKATMAGAILSISDPASFNLAASAQWTLEQRDRHTESLAAIIDPEAYDRATRGRKTKEELEREAAARLAILEPDAFNAQVRQRMTPAELAQLEADRASFAGAAAVPTGN